MISANMEGVDRPMRLLLMVQVGVALYALGIVLLIQGLYQGLFPPSLASATERVFPFLTLVAGFLGGVHFPLANKVYLKGRKEVGRIGGLIYGIDLAGSAIGALVISVILVPIAGVAQGIALIVVVNLSAILCLGMAALRKG
jgi:predicted membrane-bound spermidine synthase